MVEVDDILNLQAGVLDPNDLDVDLVTRQGRCPEVTVAVRAFTGEGPASHGTLRAESIDPSSKRFFLKGSTLTGEFSGWRDFFSE